MSALDEIVRREGLVQIASLSSSGGYDWSETAVFYQVSSGRFYWFSDSGCSCNYFGDWLSFSDMGDGDRAAAIAALKTHTHYTDEPSAEVVERECANIRDFRPAVSA